MNICFPYENVEPLDIPERNLQGIYQPGLALSGRDEAEIIRDAFLNPVGTPAIKDMVKPGQKVLLVCDDNTRPTPVYKILPHLLAELKSAGTKRDDIKILVASGTHRPMTGEELNAKLGAEAVKQFTIVQHEWTNKDKLEFWGNTSLGIPVWVNREIKGADFIIGLGLIMPLVAAGFTGGGKIIVPGICGQETNDRMHWVSVDYKEDEIFGRRDNPVRENIDQVARSVGLNVIVNLIIGRERKIIGLVVGDLVEAHRHGCGLAIKAFGVHIPQPADIVIADGDPFDIEFWQVNKALDAAGMAVKKKGVVILVSPCYEGVSRSHPEILKYGYRKVAEIKQMVQDGLISRTVGVHMIQVSRVAVEKASCILVSDGISPRHKEKLGLLHADTPQQALKKAFSLLGTEARVSVLRRAAEMLPIIGNS